MEGGLGAARLNSALEQLAERLCRYRPPPAHHEGDGNSGREGDRDAGGVTSSIGLPVETPLRGGHTRKASVLVCLFQDEPSQSLRVILTKRGSALSTHSGEVALPGGKMDQEDADEVATALREAEEEIGLSPSSVRVLTRMQTFLSKHLLSVTPVVSLLPDRASFQPVLNRAEVEDMFDAPLDMFLEDNSHRTEETHWRGVPYTIHYFDYQADNGRRYLIWGLTAAILIRAASIVLERSPNFQEFSTSPLSSSPLAPHPSA